MESKKRRYFPDAFKREAVDRARTSGLTIIEVAEEVGLHETVLRRWMRRFGPPETTDLAAENARLKRELQKGRNRARHLRKSCARHCACTDGAHGSLFGKGAR